MVKLWKNPGVVSATAAQAIHAALGSPVSRHAVRHTTAVATAHNRITVTSAPPYPPMANAGSSSAGRPGAWIE